MPFSEDLENTSFTVLIYLLYLHSIDTGVFQKNLVIFRQGRHKKDAIYVVKTVNPLFTLRSLATHIKHVKH